MGHKYRLFTLVPRNLEEIRREKSQMVVDILLLLSGLVFSIDEPDVNNRYVEYSPGNTNLVSTVPHDGQTRLDSIPIRENGCRDVVGGVAIIQAVKTAKSLSYARLFCIPTPTLTTS